MSNALWDASATGSSDATVARPDSSTSGSTASQAGHLRRTLTSSCAKDAITPCATAWWRSASWTASYADESTSKATQGRSHSARPPAHLVAKAKLLPDATSSACRKGHSTTQRGQKPQRSRQARAEGAFRPCPGREGPCRRRHRGTKPRASRHGPTQEVQSQKLLCLNIGYARPGITMKTINRNLTND